MSFQIMLLLILILSWICILFFSSNNETREIYNFKSRQLTMRDGTKLHVPGECENDSDCLGNLVCVGNVCTLDSTDHEIENKCDETKGCYTLLVAIDSIGIPIVECLPTQSQLFNGSDCQFKNEYNCKNGDIDTGFNCIAESGYKTLEYTTFGGAQTIPYTIENTSLVKLIQEKNKNVFRVV